MPDSFSIGSIMMYSLVAPCIVHGAHCTVHNVKCTMYTPHYTTVIDRHCTTLHILLHDIATHDITLHYSI